MERCRLSRTRQDEPPEVYLSEAGLYAFQLIERGFSARRRSPAVGDGHGRTGRPVQGQDKPSGSAPYNLSIHHDDLYFDDDTCHFHLIYRYSQCRVFYFYIC